MRKAIRDLQPSFQTMFSKPLTYLHKSKDEMIHSTISRTSLNGSDGSVRNTSKVMSENTEKCSEKTTYSKEKMEFPTLVNLFPTGNESASQKNPISLDGPLTSSVPSTSETSCNTTTPSTSASENALAISPVNDGNETTESKPLKSFGIIQESATFAQKLFSSFQTPISSSISILSTTLDRQTKGIPTKIKHPNRVLPSVREYELQMVKETPKKNWAHVFSVDRLYSKNKLGSTSSKSIDNKIFKGKGSIVIIGIHGWFPTRLIQRVVGEPTGTSSRFIEKMSEAVHIFHKTHFGYEVPAENIETIALEGEGLIENRVALFVKEIKAKHLKSLKSAKQILVVSHSQGFPVAVLLVNELLQEGILHSFQGTSPAQPHSQFWQGVARLQGSVGTQVSQNIAILGMAGISHGPFPSLKQNLIVQYVEADAARQLFDMNDPSSSIYGLFHPTALALLDSNIKIAVVGSWYDQVVPLYSSIMQGLSHRNIYRAIYIEGVDYIPDFVSHLVVFALKMRNFGVDDHNIIVHLSDVIAGNIYGFGTQGHSTLYEDVNTYLLLLEWASMTHPSSPLSASNASSKSITKTNVMHQSPFSHWLSKSNGLFKSLQQNSPQSPPNHFPHSPKDLQTTLYSPFKAPLKLNPFFLPWIMAQLHSDPLIQKHPILKQEWTELMDIFRKWEPTTKVMKELKYRLEPLKSKL